VPFDKHNDKIAVTVPFFQLFKSQDGVRKRNAHANEPYLVTLAVDSRGRNDPQIEFNSSPFPNVRRNEKVEMLGDGHLVYGPSNPGEFAAVSVLLMESDDEYRSLGDRLEKFVKHSATEGGLKALLGANAAAGAVAAGLAQATGLLARLLKDNEDDEVLRITGTFFRDRPVPFDVNRQVTRFNDEARIGLKVIPLTEGNGQGTATRCVKL
jgi:hypothetical protein